MAKIKLGDLFELKTSKGYAYIHYIHKNDDLGELIRVLPKIYKKRPVNFNEIVSQKEKFIVFFPLSAATRKKLVEYIGFYNCENYTIPKYMRTEHNVRGEFLGWHIVNIETWQRNLVKSLTSEQKKLSPWGIWNISLLKERIIQDWKIEDWV